MLKKIADHLPKIIFAPSVIAIGVFVYGFIAWTLYISFTRSRLLPKYDLTGTIQYERLFSSPRWEVAFDNLFIFVFFFIIFSTIIGLTLAVLLDQKIRFEGFIRTVYLYPFALSMIVTGTAWKWLMNPGLGLEAQIQSWGWKSFKFDWIVNPDWSIYAIIVAAVWQSSGFVMSLFLAGLRSINQEIIQSARIDGIADYRIYLSIIFPTMAPIFFSSFVVLTHIAIKSFDLVIAMTSGGPGYSSDMPATYMYAMAFNRGDLGQSAASAMVMMLIIFSIMVPYLYSELRQKASS